MVQITLSSFFPSGIPGQEVPPEPNRLNARGRGKKKVDGWADGRKDFLGTRLNVEPQNYYACKAELQWKEKKKEA